MKAFLDVLERYDQLWDHAEQHIASYFESLNANIADTSSPTTPDLKELNSAVTILKRIQDARRAIQRDAIKVQEPSTHDNDKNGNEPDAEEQKRILKVLERIERTEEHDLEKSDTETL